MQIHSKNKRMSSYLALGIAITALKSSDSFSRLVPAIVTEIGYGTAL